MLHLKNTEFELLPEQNIIKSSEYAAFVEAQGIIALAETKAKRIEADAKQAYEEEKARGLREGMNEGKLKMTEHMIQYVQKTVEQLEHYEDTVVDMVMSAMKQVLGDMDDKEVITRVVSKALNLVKSQPKIILRVCPTQVEMVDEALKDILRQYPSIQFIDVQRDDRLHSGDCILETDMGVIDARLDLQLESIRKTLKKLIK
jgi:type III secretion protein L